MQEQKEIFTSPIRKYLSQKLQLSFDFAGCEDETKTFETPQADYEVRKIECYLTKEQARKEGTTILDYSCELKVKGLSLFLSSSWYEIFTIYTDDLFEGICQGNENEIVEDLLWLELQKEHFSYNSKCNDDGDSDEGCYLIRRPLNQEEKKSLDSLIKQKLDLLYRK